MKLLAFHIQQITRCGDACAEFLDLRGADLHGAYLRGAARAHESGEAGSVEAFALSLLQRGNF